MITNERAGTPAQLMTLFAERASGGDADGLIALYEAGAVFEPQFGVVLRGLDEIRSALSELAALRPSHRLRRSARRGDRRRHRRRVEHVDDDR